MKVFQLTSLLLLSSILFAQLPLTQIGNTIQASAEKGFMGESISLNSDGKIIAIGTARTFDGFVQVFTHSGTGIWQQVGSNIEGSGGRFGKVSLSNDGNRVAIGAWGGKDTLDVSTGYVEIYDFNGNDWVQVGQTLYGTFEDEHFGEALSLSGDGSTLVIGSPDFTQFVPFKENVGKTQVYSYTSDSWVQVGEDLVGSSRINRMGGDVDIDYDGNTLVTSEYAYSDGTSLPSIGRIRVYSLINGDWNQVGQDIVGKTANEKLGLSARINAAGSVVSAGSPSTTVSLGKVSVFSLNNDVWESKGSEIIGTQTGDIFGQRHDLDSLGQNLIIGAELKDSPLSFAGEVKTFTFITNEWQESGLRTRGLAPADQYGRSISISQDANVIAGAAPLNEDKFSFGGNVRVYQLDNLTGLFSESKSDLDYTIYPTYVKDQLNISLTNLETSNYQLTVVSSKGESVLFKNNVHLGTDQLNMDVSNLLKGVYLLKINTEFKTATLRFIKE